MRDCIQRLSVTSALCFNENLMVCCVFSSQIRRGLYAHSTRLHLWTAITKSTRRDQFSHSTGHMMDKVAEQPVRSTNTSPICIDTNVASCAPDVKAFVPGKVAPVLL